MTSTDRLAEELRRRAQDLPDPHPLSLEDVHTRARGIRRRRYAATGLAAAAVLAVTVPLGLVAQDRLDRTSQGPVDRPGEGRSVIEDGTPEPAPTPTDLPRRLTLTSDVPSTGVPPGLGYLAGGVLHRPDGSSVEVQGAFDTLLPLGGGYVVSGSAADTGERSTGFLDASGDLGWTEPSVGVPVLSPSGRLVAYGRADGTTLTVEEDGVRRAFGSARPEGFEVAAVLDDGGSCTTDGAGCTVYSNSTMDLTAVAQSRSGPSGGGAAEGGDPVDDLAAQVESVSPTGRLALTVSADASSLCSAVAEPGGDRLWRTCAWQLGSFSPDERFVLAYPLGDGGGPRGVALLDSTTGEVVREYAVTGRADVFVNRAVWETADAVLATVWDTDHWSVLRLGTDGSRAAVPVEGLDDADDPDAVPVALAG